MFCRALILLVTMVSVSFAVRDYWKDHRHSYNNNGNINRLYGGYENNRDREVENFRDNLHPKRQLDKYIVQPSFQHQYPSEYLGAPAYSQVPYGSEESYNRGQEYRNPNDDLIAGDYCDDVGAHGILPRMPIYREDIDRDHIGHVRNAHSHHDERYGTDMDDETTNNAFGTRYRGSLHWRPIYGPVPNDFSRSDRMAGYAKYNDGRRSNTNFNANTNNYGHYGNRGDPRGYRNPDIGNPGRPYEAAEMLDRPYRQPSPPPAWPGYSNRLPMNDEEYNEPAQDIGSQNMNVNSNTNIIGARQYHDTPAGAEYSRPRRSVDNTPYEPAVDKNEK